MYEQAFSKLTSTPGWASLSEDLQEQVATPLQRHAEDDGSDNSTISQLRADNDACTGRLHAAVEKVHRIVEGNRVVNVSIEPYFKDGVNDIEQLDAALKGLREECEPLLAPPSNRKILHQVGEVEKQSRHAISNVAQSLRRLLEDEYTAQLDGIYDIRSSGLVATEPGEHLTPERIVTRGKIVAAVEYHRAAGLSASEAVDRFVRDAAFTTLNRFVALKMLEGRELIQEAVSGGENSVGYREYTGLAPGVATLGDGEGYRLYLESLFDELASEIKVLFDRQDAASLLWPRNAFEAMLAELNNSDLDTVWEDDETIGWFYQFFNSKEERQQMRDESQAPRNSRELAVRNQFFTPRYVVQFLVDNTLGRIWIEMTGGDTRLAEKCEYFVTLEEQRRPRPFQDPRDFKILDPACGSGHFLLYCFDLLDVMYHEAWERGLRVDEATEPTLRDNYETIEELERAIPVFIVERNLHGIDIDPRAAQIAALAIWLRAQGSWRDAGISADQCPQIRRTGVVIAEPRYRATPT